ncbi:MAG TPA: MdtA/MuxA family multidrug efflux RND transporter periplasmic adaptor subunit, partial [Steroidobacteraceae bacterium]
VAVLVAVIAWAMKPGSQPASGPGGRGRGAGAGGPIPVRAVAATTGSVDVSVDALGTVSALSTATIHSRVDGPLLQVPFREGQLVKAGDVLAQIDPSTFKSALNQAEGQLAKDQAQLSGARVDLERYTGLLAKDSIARQTVDAQRFTVQQLEGAVRADKAAVENARLQLSFTRITAPLAGRAGLRQVDPGNMVHAGDTNGLVVLTQIHPIYVVFAVPSEHLAQIYPHWSKGEALRVEALNRDGKVLAQGRLAAVDNQIDITTGTIKLKAQFDNTDDALFPDQFVTARLRMETVSGATLVPSAAVQRGAPGTFVYVVNADNTVSLRRMTLGPASGDLVSVQDGVKPGERVVIDGLDKLREGAQVALIADNTRGALPPGAPAQTPAQRPRRRPPGATSAPAAVPPVAPARTTS